MLDERQVLARMGILALRSSEKVRISFGSKVMETPPFRTKNSATN